MKKSPPQSQDYFKPVVNVPVEPKPTGDVPVNYTALFTKGTV